MGLAPQRGWRYQALAVFLTYSGIVAAYVPMEIQAAFEEMESAQPAEEGEDLLPTSLEEADAVAVEVVGDTDIAPLAAEATLPRVEEAWQEPVGAGGLLIGFAILVGLIYAAPFLGGFENVLGWVILAIALYEAWKLNRREELVFEGPLQIPGTRPAYVPEIPPPPISP